MKSRAQSVSATICALLLVGAIVLIGINQNTAGRLRVENEALARAQVEARELTQQDGQLQPLREENAELQQLRTENKDLPKLRNQVRQLRREADEVEKLRAENQRLRSLPKAAVDQHTEPAPLVGFIPRTALADMGLSTPEATVQTMLWAMCQGNLERVAQISVHNVPIGGNTEHARQDMMAQFSKFPGFAITGRKDIAPDEVIIETKTSAGGAAMPVKLTRVENEWKLLER